MPQQVDFLFAGGFRGAQRRVFGPQRLQLPIALFEFPRGLLRVRKSIEQRELPVRRKERLMIVRSVQIDQLVAQILQHGERGRRSIDELAVCARRRKAAFHDQLALARFDARLAQLRIQFFQLGPFEDCFDGANIGAGADQRFVGSFAEEQLQRADDDRFARAGFSRDGGESRRELPFQILDQRQVLDSQQGQNGGHREEVES